MLLWVVAITTLCAMLWLVHYLRRVPDSTCPRCGEPLVRAGGPAGDGPSVSPLRWWTVPARCPVCDWDGRMKRAPSREVVRARRPDPDGEANR